VFCFCSRARLEFGSKLRLTYLGVVVAFPRIASVREAIQASWCFSTGRVSAANFRFSKGTRIHGNQCWWPCFRGALRVRLVTIASGIPSRISRQLRLIHTHIVSMSDELDSNFHRKISGPISSASGGSVTTSCSCYATCSTGTRRSRR
jgi:hypothetical protein